MQNCTEAVKLTNFGIAQSDVVRGCRPNLSNFASGDRPNMSYFAIINIFLALLLMQLLVYLL